MNWGLPSIVISCFVAASDFCVEPRKTPLHCQTASVLSYQKSNYVERWGERTTPWAECCCLPTHVPYQMVSPQCQQSLDSAATFLFHHLHHQLYFISYQRAHISTNLAESSSEAFFMWGIISFNKKRKEKKMKYIICLQYTQRALLFVKLEEWSDGLHCG